MRREVEGSSSQESYYGETGMSFQARDSITKSLKPFHIYMVCNSCGAEGEAMSPAVDESESTKCAIRLVCPVCNERNWETKDIHECNDPDMLHLFKLALRKTSAQFN